jgi:transposase
VTADGGVPIWHHAFDGQTADVGTVVAQMEALRQQMLLPECLVIGDTKLLAEEVIAKLRGQHLHFLAPLAAHKDLDTEFLALDPKRWEKLEYVAQRQERLPEEQRTQYEGQEVAWEWKNPKTGATEVFRRLYVISSEERATCRKVRGQQMARAEEELTKIARGLGKRELKSAARVEARVAATLSKRRVTPFYEVTIGEVGGVPTLSWAVNAAALQRGEALDGYYVLLCSWSKEQATSSALLGKWKQEAVIERRYSDWKGPLRVRPVFVTSNQRMAALMLLLHLALMIYCLIEREARRRLVEQGRTKMARLLAGHVAAVPTGENLLLAFEHLFLIIEEEEHGRYYEMTALDALQRELWHLLKIEPIEWF